METMILAQELFDCAPVSGTGERTFSLALFAYMDAPGLQGHLQSL
jgi:hypothetical protein